MNRLASEIRCIIHHLYGVTIMTYLPGASFTCVYMCIDFSARSRHQGHEKFIPIPQYNVLHGEISLDQADYTVVWDTVVTVQSVVFPWVLSSFHSFSMTDWSDPIYMGPMGPRKLCPILLTYHAGPMTTFNDLSNRNFLGPSGLWVSKLKRQTAVQVIPWYVI